MKGLMQQSDEFKKQCAAMMQDFNKNGPFSAKLSPNDALNQIANLKAQLAALKQQEAQIKQGLSILFNIYFSVKVVIDKNTCQN